MRGVIPDQDDDDGRLPYHWQCRRVSNTYIAWRIGDREGEILLATVYVRGTQCYVGDTIILGVARAGTSHDISYMHPLLSTQEAVTAWDAFAPSPSGSRSE